MADNAAQALKDLNASLEKADKNLTSMTQTLSGFFNQIRQAGGDVKAIFDYISQKAGKNGATQSEKIKILAEMVDANGKPLTESTVKERIKKLTSAVDSRESKVKIGTEFVDSTKMRDVINQYREYLRLLKMTPAQWQNTVMSPIDTALGIKKDNKQYSPKTIQDAEDKKSVERLGEKKVKIDSLNKAQFTNNELLAKRRDLEKEIAALESQGKTRGRIVQAKKEYEEVNKAVQEYLAKLSTYNKFGEQALKGFKNAGLLTNSDKEQINLERQQIDLLRQRMQAEQQLNRLLLQRDNATLAGKNISPRVSDSISRLQERIDVIDKQRVQSYQGFTQISLQRIEGMWQNHETALTTIKTQGEQSRQRIIDKQNAELEKQKQAEIRAKEQSEKEKTKQQEREAKERERIAREEARIESQLRREVANATRAQEAQLAKDRQIDNRYAIKQQELEEKRLRQERLAQSKAAYSQQNRIEKEAVANMRRQIQIKQRLAEIDHNRLANSGNRTKEEKAEYAALNRELTQLISKQKELRAINSGATSRARGITASYAANFQTKEAERYLRLLQKHGEQQNNNKLGLESMLPTLQRLASAFGVAFSVQGLVQFGKTLVETRGKFEMQFVAMKQLIGDVDAATKIWNQTMQQALNSPFTAMQLTDYTKKLAAYRIETDKLFDTTKRLADVSAGLGVDMSRLILAYGQVKSANFLRASEIRQFTEAGVNIVGSLSDYFTELEGRAVSIADVMERVTKRMVMYSDVEEIFRRMTDEGGMFYNMQVVQADTVKGQISKLHDAYDQMLNTIGQANQGTIRNLIESLNSLVLNWRDVVAFLKNSAIAVGVLTAALKLNSITWKSATASSLFFRKEITIGGESLKKYRINAAAGAAATTGLRAAMIKLGAAARITGAAISALRGVWGIVGFVALEAIVGWITKLHESDRAAKQLSNSLDDIGSKNAQSLQDNIDGFTNLVERLKQATEGSQNYYDIRNKIQSQYGEYLDNLETEQITVENLANSYNHVVERMREKSRAHIMEEGLDEITRSYGDAISNFTKSITNTIFNGYKISSDEAVNIAKKMYDIYSKSPLGKYKDKNVLFFEAFKQYTGRDISNYSKTGYDYGRGFQESIISRYEKQLELETKANSLTKAQANTHQEYLDQLELEDEHKRKIDELNNKRQSKDKTEVELQAENLRYEEAKLELQAKYQKKSSDWLDKEKAKLKENLGAFIDAYNAQVELYIGSKYGSGWKKSDNVAAWSDYRNMIAKSSDIAQGQSRWEESILNDKKTTEEAIQRLKEEQATQTATDAKASASLNEQIEKENHRLELIKKQMELLGLHEKEKKSGSGGSSNNSIYGERIRLLKDMLQKYRELAKEAYGYAKAEGKVTESFEDAWKNIMPLGYGAIDVPTSSKELATMLQRLEEFTPQFDKNGKLSKMMADLKEAIAESLSNVDIELSVRVREDFGRQMEEAFGNYELTLELQKLNLPKGLASEMWGIEETDLQDLRTRLTEMYNGLRDETGKLSTDAFKDYEKFLNKIDDLERKQQRERLKDYAKYLETQYSDRVKIEMEYIQKLSRLEAETAIPEAQKSAIREGLRKEFDDKSRKQDWEDFKGSEFYVEMMEDLEKQGTASLEVMRKKLLEMRSNAENLSPRALKEVVNALEKIDEIESKRTQPLKRVRDAQKALDGVNMKEVYEELSINQEQLALSEEKEHSMERAIMLIQKRNELDEQGYTIEEARVRLSQANQARGFAQSVLDSFKADGTKESQDNLATLEQVLNSAKADVEKWQEIVNILSGKAIIDEQAKGNKYTTLDLGELQERRKNLKQSIKDLQGVIGKEEELVKLNKELNDAWDATYEVIKNWASSVQGVFDGVMDNVDYFSDSTYGMVTAWKEFGDTSVLALNDLVSGIQAYRNANAEAEKNNEATGLFTANGLKLALVVLGVLMKIVQAIAKQHDAALDKQIQIQQERIDALRDAYARLEKQIDRTLSTMDYIGTYNQQVQNLKEQITALEEQIRAENAKKNTDKDRINEYNNAIQDAEDQLEELRQKQIEIFGGIGEDNYRSAAEEFVEAWKDAFMETGDGLQGLQDHFDEFLSEWFVKQATMRGAAKMLEPVFKQIDDAVSEGSPGDMNVTMAEVQGITDGFNNMAPALSEFLENLYGMFGIGGEGGLSGLAAGIQGMTEEQANILEAYWNSVRMYTANIDSNVARIADILGAGGVNTNPQLQQLQLIEQNTKSIQLILQSTVKSGHSQGGNGIKVFVN